MFSEDKEPGAKKKAGTRYAPALLGIASHY
jgi:hypothetical protein